MATDEINAYDYEQLAHRDSIRLLELLPGPTGSPLKCNIIDARKNDAPMYEALSYAWGEPTMSHTIEEASSHATLHLTSSLQQALHAIRSENTPRVLWVDAICINQSDLREKGHQVALMGQIYRDAERVVVWLGCQNIPPDRLQALLTELVQVTKDWHTHRGSHSGNSSILANKVKSLSRRLSILRVFDQPWYTRVWVVQEYVLAQQIQWIAANVVLPPGLIEHAVESLQSLTHELTIWGPDNTEDTTELYATGTHIHQLLLQRQKRTPVSRPEDYVKGSSLASCFVKLSANRECKDPRDRLYALLALTDDDLDIKPDYNQSASTVFIDFAMRSFLKGELTLLHVSGIHPEIEDGSSSFSPWITNRDYVTNPLDAPEFRFKAALMFPAKVDAFAADMLSIRGVHVDAVRLSIVGHRKNISFRAYYWSFAGWFMSNQNQSNINGNVEDLSHDQLDALGPVSPYVNHDLRTTFGLLTTLETKSHEGISGYFLFDTIIPVPERWQKDCSVFMTEQGYLGYGPFWKQPGDQVVIFDGAPNPVLLRKVATKDGIDHWHLVGECYLLGWMNGNYFGHTVVDELPPDATNDEHDKKYLVKEWFVLC